MSFDILPAELYEAIFGYISPSVEVPKTVLAVSRAIPLSRVPLHHLYHNIVIKRADQAVGLYTNLNRAQKKLDSNSYNGKPYVDVIASWINEISVEAWDVDAEVLVNIFRLLIHSCPSFQPRSLNIWIGPRNFAPEHLQKLFIEPLPSLQYLSLRFKPYVQKATYQQFLKGVYFDSTLKAIGSWPHPTLPTISIVQDPMDQTLDRPTFRFAQPLVFFKLDIASFIRSPALLELKSLRFRIPARPVARNLCPAPSPQTYSNGTYLANLKFLDLSTSGVLDADLNLLLIRFPLLEHLVLDGCSLSFTADMLEGEWRELGKRLALIGTQRAREKEKSLKEYDDIRALSQSMAAMGVTVPGIQSAGHEGKKPKPGRKGLATATISLRAPEFHLPSFIPNAPSLPVQTSAHLERNSSSTSALASVSGSELEVSQTPSTEHPPASSIHPDSEPTDSKEPFIKGKHKKKHKKKPSKKPATKIRVLPSLPSLLSFSMSLSSHVPEERHPHIRDQFEQGWVEGISQLETILARTRASAMNGVRVMRLIIGPSSKTSLSNDSDSDISSGQESDKSGSSSKSVYTQRLSGLEDVDLTDPDAFGLNENGVERATIPVPVLCFAGPGKQGRHADNCGHYIAWEMMKDDL